MLEKIILSTIKNKTHAILIVVLFTLFIISRVVFLDGDLPPWQISFYQPIDELYYTISAFNLFHFSGLASSPISGEIPEGSPANLVQTVITTISLFIFGNNYFGLRMASVVAGGGSLILLAQASTSSIKTLPNISKLDDTRLMASVATCIALFIFDFSFNIGSRVAEPTIFSVLYTSFFIFILSRVSLIRSGLSFTLGLVAGCAPLYCYLYLAFLLPATLITIIIYSRQNSFQEMLLNVVYYLSGIIVSIISYFVLIFFLTNGRVKDYVSVMAQGGGQRVAGVPLTLLAIKSYLYDFIAGNMFRFNPACLLLFILSIIVLAIYLYRRQWAFIHIFLISALIFRFSQFLFLSDHFHRKLLDTLPLVFVLISTGIYILISGELLKSRSKIFIYGAALVASTILFWNILLTHRVFGYIFGKPLNIYGGENIGLGQPGYAAIISSTSIALISLFLYFSKTQRVRWIATFGIFAALAIPGVVFSCKFIYSNPSFIYRDTLLSLASSINGKILVGGYSYAFRLYNSSRPFLNPYTFMGTDKAFEEKTRCLLDRNEVWGSITTYPPPISLNSRYKTKKILRLKNEFIVIGDVENRLKKYVYMHK